MEERRVEYGGGKIEEIHELLNNLKGVENLELLNCYGSRLKGCSQETTLVLSNTRELDRVPNTK